MNSTQMSSALRNLTCTIANTRGWKKGQVEGYMPLAILTNVYAIHLLLSLVHSNIVDALKMGEGLNGQRTMQLWEL